jgi:hypothetical protein
MSHNKVTLSGYFKNLWTAFEYTTPDYCTANLKQAIECIYLASVKYPTLDLCQPLGHRTQAVSPLSHLPHVGKLLHPDVSALILNDKKDKIIAITNKKGVVSEVSPAIPVPMYADKDKNTEGNIFHIGSIPVIVSDSKDSEIKLQNEVANSKYITTDQIREEIVQGIDVPMAPDIKPAIYVAQTMFGKQPVMVNPHAPQPPPLPARPPKARIVAPVNDNNQISNLLGQIEKNNVKLKSVTDRKLSEKKPELESFDLGKILADTRRKFIQPEQKDKLKEDSDDEFD